MNLVTEKSTVRIQLRDVTANIHEALHHTENFAAIAEGRLERDGYAAVLTMLYRYHQGLSEICKRGAQLLGQDDLAKAHRARIAALEADMEYLGTTPRSKAPSDKGEGAFAAGCLYTVQGSSLGGKQIYRQLDYLLPDERGRAFFKGGGQDGRLWQGLCAALERLGPSPALQEGALYAFERFQKLLP